MSLKRRLASAAAVACALATAALLAATAHAQTAPSPAIVHPMFPCTGYVALHTTNGQYLDIRNRAATGIVQTWTYNGGTNQQWCFESDTGGTGAYYIHTANGGACLDESNNPTVYVLKCDGSTRQLWFLTPSGGWIKPYLAANSGISPLGVGNPVHLTAGNGWVWQPR